MEWREYRAIVEIRINYVSGDLVQVYGQNKSTLPCIYECVEGTVLIFVS